MVGLNQGFHIGFEMSSGTCPSVEYVNVSSITVTGGEGVYFVSGISPYLSDYLIVSERDGISAINLSLEIVGRAESIDGGFSSSIEVDPTRGLAYTTGSTSGGGYLSIFDISDPTDILALSSTFSAYITGYEFYLSGQEVLLSVPETNYLFWSNSEYFGYIDVSNISSPTFHLLDTTEIISIGNSLVRTGNHILRFVVTEDAIGIESWGIDGTYHAFNPIDWLLEGVFGVEIFDAVVLGSRLYTLSRNYDEFDILSAELISFNISDPTNIDIIQRLDLSLTNPDIGEEGGLGYYTRMAIADECLHLIGGGYLGDPDPPPLQYGEEEWQTIPVVGTLIVHLPTMVIKGFSYAYSRSIDDVLYFNDKIYIGDGADPS